MLRRVVEVSARKHKKKIEKEIHGKSIKTKPSDVLGKPCKRKRKIDDDDEEERRLEELVLGGHESIVNKWIERSPDKPVVEKDDERKAAWFDEDDDITLADAKKLKRFKLTGEEEDQKKVSYKKHLQKKFTQVYATPTWATLKEKDEKSSDDSDSDDEILGRAGDFLAKKTPYLEKNVISLAKCKRLNFTSDTRVNRGLQAVEFHPHSTVALIADRRKTVSLVQVDGKQNPVIQLVKFKNIVLKSAHFSPNGEELIVGSNQQNNALCYDMMSGKISKLYYRKEMWHSTWSHFKYSPDGRVIAVAGDNGYVYFISANSKQFMWSTKMNGYVTSMSFNKDGSRLYTHGSDGHVHIWDMRTGDCIHRFYDDGCVRGTALDVSGSDEFLACGTDSGIVNVYRTDSLYSSAAPKPIKCFSNLTTKITSLKFNSTSEILAMTSNVKENAFRLAHVSSMSVFANFPSLRMNIGFIKGVDFSLNSGYMTIPCQDGKALLYRLQHYKTY